MYALALALLLAADPASAAPESSGPGAAPAADAALASTLPPAAIEPAPALAPAPPSAASAARRSAQATTAEALAAAQALEDALLAPDDVQVRRLSAWRPRFRTGFGAAGIVDVEGLAPQGELGLDLRAASRLGLRITAGGAMRVGWGVFSLAPEAVLRLTPPDRLLTPYLAAGVQVAVLNIRDGQRGARGDTATARFAAGSTPGGEAGDEQGGGGGGTPLAFSIGPQATAGVAIRLTRRLSLDVAGRYTLTTWRDEQLSGLGGLVALSAEID